MDISEKNFEQHLLSSSPLVAERNGFRADEEGVSLDDQFASAGEGAFGAAFGLLAGRSAVHIFDRIL